MVEADEGQRFKDLWAWADDEESEERLPAVDPGLVTAVVVVRDAGAWLPDQLDALGRLEPRPRRIVAVDVASADDSLDQLRAAREAGLIDDIVAVARDEGFAAAVAAGVGDDGPDWLWVLHDDSLPEADALGRLLATAGGADVLFPKLLAPRRRNYPDVIDECGQSITRGGHRMGAAEEGEIDQFQLEPAAVLGGSTAGMLVRGETWRELGGLAPELPGFREGVDLGWRANLAGWRVVTEPHAALVHLHAGKHHERGDDHPHFRDRLAALRVVAARGANPARLALGTWGRALGFLLAKSPATAAAELRAHRTLLGTPEATRSLAARIPEGDEEGIEDLLAPKFWLVRNAVDRIGNAVMERYRHFTTSETTLDDLTSDEFSTHTGRDRRRVSPAALLVGLFLVVGIAAGWRLWGTGALSGGGLLPAPNGVAAAWDAYLATGAPALGIGAAVGTATFGNPGIAAYLLVLLGPALAAWAGFALLGDGGVRPWLAAAGGAMWGAAVLVLGLPAAGDVSGMVLAIAGPLFARACLRIATDDATGAEGLRRPAAAAFWLFVAAAFWPTALLLATLGVAVLLGVRRAAVVRWLAAVVPVWLLFLPWLGELFAHPGRWLTGVDPMAWAHFPPSGLALFVGRIVPSGVPLWLSVVFFVGLALLAAAGVVLIQRARTRWVVAGGIAVALIAGVALSRAALPIAGGEARVQETAWALLVVAGLIGAVVLAERPRDHAHPEGLAVKALAVLALVGVVAWPFVGFRGPVDTRAPELPGYVRDVLRSARDSRALLIDKDGDLLSWNVVDARRPQWGSAEAAPAGAFEDEFAGLVQAFTGGNVPEDVAQRLQGLAVSHVWLDGFSDDELLAVGNAAGLSRAAASDTATVFTVTGLVSRANVVADSGATPVVDGVVAEGGGDRLLVISEPADAPVEATVGGVPLERVDGDGELATFAIGDAAGELAYGAPREPWAPWLSGAVLAALALLALPTLGQASGARRVDEEDAA